MMAQISVPTKSDSVYNKIYTISQEKKFYKFLHKVLFRSVDASEIEKLSSKFSFISNSIDEKTMRWLELQD